MAAQSSWQAPARPEPHGRSSPGPSQFEFRHPQDRPPPALRRLASPPHSPQGCCSGQLARADQPWRMCSTPWSSRTYAPPWPTDPPVRLPALSSNPPYPAAAADLEGVVRRGHGGVRRGAGRALGRVLRPDRQQPLLRRGGRADGRLRQLLPDRRRRHAPRAGLGHRHRARGRRGRGGGDDRRAVLRVRADVEAARGDAGGRRGEHRLHGRQRVRPAAAPAVLCACCALLSPPCPG